MTPPPPGSNRIGRVIHDVRSECIARLIRALRERGRERTGGEHAVWLAGQLASAHADPAAIRELLRGWILQPPDIRNPRVRSLRRAVGWSEDASDFSTLLPELLDVLFLLPPRDAAVFETLSALIGGADGPQFSSLLDVGTGTGLLPELLFAAGYRGSLTGIDPARPLLDYARNRLGIRPDLELFPERIQDYRPRPGSAAAALSYMVLHHVPDTAGQYAAALATIFLALADGGVFVYVDKLYSVGGSPAAAFDLEGARPRATLPGGLKIEAELSPRNPAQPFMPHPAGLREFHRPWQDAAVTLVETGFRIDRTKILNERVVLFFCRKPVG